jgi:very-short-patch-repair endonuclease
LRPESAAWRLQIRKAGARWALHLRLRCRDRSLVVEVDGGQHLESKRDEIRDAYLAKRGYRVMRFWNNHVLSNIDGVMTVLEEALRRVERHG